MEIRILEQQTLAIQDLEATEFNGLPSGVKLLRLTAMKINGAVTGDALIPLGQDSRKLIPPTLFLAKAPEQLPAIFTNTHALRRLSSPDCVDRLHSIAEPFLHEIVRRGSPRRLSSPIVSIDSSTQKLPRQFTNTRGLHNVSSPTVSIGYVQQQIRPSGRDASVCALCKAPVIRALGGKIAAGTHHFQQQVFAVVDPVIDVFVPGSNV
ncbi:hypothetical protein BaRGS_00017220 [Batillaria attramentaria]|uniref:Uncharacterized protein n=1 Tax=Batillaria attramentaria TaxID=370345 RepID=A0ABD0KWZ5_9CAEN